MSATGALVTYLRAQATVTDLLGAAGNVWHRRVPQGASYPRVMLQRIGSDATRHLAGVSAIEQTLYEVLSLAETAAEAEAVAEAIDALLNGYRGAMGAVWVSGCGRTELRDGDVATTQGTEERRFEVRQEYVIGWHATA